MKTVAEEVLTKLVEKRKRLKMDMKFDEAAEMKKKMNVLFGNWYHTIIR